MKRAAGSLRGSAEYRPRWSVRITSASASTRLATSAPSVSLSPNLISSLTTVSFSLMTGITLQRQQRQQGGARIEIALAVGQVGMRQQHLRAAHAMFRSWLSRTSAPGPSARRRQRPATRGSSAWAAWSSPGASCLRRSRRWTPSPVRGLAGQRGKLARTSCRWHRRRRRALRW
jgi:hypothetical protein